MSQNPKYLSAICQCGKVKFEATGAPILTGACYCTSCQQAGQQIAQAPSAPPMLDADGGTSFVLYRKDRVHCVTGQEHLEERRLKPSSPTRRVVATCCHSAMFLDFTKGHWLSIYRNRIPEGAPPLEMRMMTSERPAGVTIPSDVSAYERHSAKFMRRLIVAWVAMGFRRPQVNLGRTASRAP
ncbi:GFA family protein [Bradyrhizobium sp. SYSU BS000235]|uniref:GFA family protein n=1 Tax=Bradyrhizobium sp. SYSU BS000235 TaxID=3411332 RepID=UPI003C71FDAD